MISALAQYYAKQLTVVAKRQLREIAQTEGIKIANAVDREFNRKMIEECETDPVEVVPDGWDLI